MHDVQLMLFRISLQPKIATVGLQEVDIKVEIRQGDHYCPNFGTLFLQGIVYIRMNCMSESMHSTRGPYLDGIDCTLTV